MIKEFYFNSVEHKSFVYTQLRCQTVLFDPLIEPYQSRPGSDGNEGVRRIPQSSSVTGASLSDCLMSYPGHWFGSGLTPLQRCCLRILQPQLTVAWNYLNKFTSIRRIETKSLFDNIVIRNYASLIFCVYYYFSFIKILDFLELKSCFAFKLRFTNAYMSSAILKSRLCS